MDLDSGDKSVLGIAGIVVASVAITGGNEKGWGAVQSEKRKCLGHNPVITGKMFTLILWPPDLWFTLGALSLCHLVG